MLIILNSITILFLLYNPTLPFPQKLTDTVAENVVQIATEPPSSSSSHDNTVQMELENSTEIAELIAQDYFTGSVLACDNNTAPGRYMVYCSGRLLQAVMAVRLYEDSKTFLDQPMKKNMTGEQIMNAFNERFPTSIANLQKKDVKDFVMEHFDKEGNELANVSIPNFNSNPARLQKILDPEYYSFAMELHQLWNGLYRQMKPEVAEHPDRYSLLYVPHPFILPGGRFREFYYWDAYWIIKGLLASQLYPTARHMILNFAHIINTRGFIPNGGRVYYLRRSQPPLFAAMVYDYYLATQDRQLVADTIPAIEKEFQFWTNRRTVNVTLEVDEGQEETISMFQYNTEAETPRPESFREDVISAKHIKNPDVRRRFFRDIASAAESGWDFSSRWFKDDKNLETIETTNIVPVDLNAFICYNMNILAFFYGELGNPIKHNQWSTSYKQFREQFTRIFYVQSRRGWYDYNIRSKMHNVNFFPTIAVPLFTQCYDPLNYRLAVDVYNQMEESGAFGYEGGVPTSLQKGTAQQWDFPNGWSPLNHMMIEGLRKSTSPIMQQKAFVLAEKWIRSNMDAFKLTGQMWEKYDIAEPRGRLGSGGEYDVQPGFGWTNGVALDLMVTYGDRLKFKKKVELEPNTMAWKSTEYDEESFSSSQSLFTTILVLAFSVLFGI
ncbi:unnamed protein product [Caenorhabditis bovis]|uniref:Trehalase n=1 Tax=Caenorhabditis bovis TaxID=2654633 RepID=A0A8S1EU17_9PELO|nr:unnamed protein product [Caenorhabditis bovis]